jgi:hypothetical protein
VSAPAAAAAMSSATSSCAPAPSLASRTGGGSGLPCSSAAASPVGCANPISLQIHGSGNGEVLYATPSLDLDP